MPERNKVPRPTRMRGMRPMRSPLCSFFSQALNQHTEGQRKPEE